jgi:hypothetical protein
VAGDGGVDGGGGNGSGGPGGQMGGKNGVGGGGKFGGGDMFTQPTPTSMHECRQMSAGVVALTGKGMTMPIMANA